MGDLVEGDDGLLAEEVGYWAREKQNVLCRYIDISRGARARFIGTGKAGATYIDLFCGPGRSKIKDGPFIDGSCVAAWRKSVEGKSPFSRIYIADIDSRRLDAAVERLSRLRAPVVPICAPAVESVNQILKRIEPQGLHFAFLDPFSLGALDFQIIKTLARRKRMDVLVHLSKMDLQRNLADNLAAAASGFDAFAPGWRKVINEAQAQRGIRNEIIDHWRDLISNLGLEASQNMRLVKGSRDQHLYWLLLLASHQLAHRFWETASNPEGQGSLF